MAGPWTVTPGHLHTVMVTCPAWAEAATVPQTTRNRQGQDSWPQPWRILYLLVVPVDFHLLCEVLHETLEPDSLWRAEDLQGRGRDTCGGPGEGSEKQSMCLRGTSTAPAPHTRRAGSYTGWARPPTPMSHSSTVESVHHTCPWHPLPHLFMLLHSGLKSPLPSMSETEVLKRISLCPFTAWLKRKTPNGANNNVASQIPAKNLNIRVVGMSSQPLFLGLCALSHVPAPL